ncbi:hypothetical protein SAMN05421740_102248 [Parapedobacter koreensis]|uniref:Uncharacterized protein n=1 Tax=Parapedobacter koreensis TaxID=332977 RepID=A0A1H7IHU4_9SPHI|nr:hypothetical protein SAMN05421740_102248 [Parapedobacter koreensis]
MASSDFYRGTTARIWREGNPNMLKIRRMDIVGACFLGYASNPAKMQLVVEKLHVEAVFAHRIRYLCLLLLPKIPKLSE